MFASLRAFRLSGLFESILRAGGGPGPGPVQCLLSLDATPEEIQAALFLLDPYPPLASSAQVLSATYASGREEYATLGYSASTGIGTEDVVVLPTGTGKRAIEFVLSAPVADGAYTYVEIREASDLSKVLFYAQLVGGESANALEAAAGNNAAVQIDPDAGTSARIGVLLDSSAGTVSLFYDGAFVLTEPANVADSVLLFGIDEPAGLGPEFADAVASIEVVSDREGITMDYGPGVTDMCGNAIAFAPPPENTDSAGYPLDDNGDMADTIGTSPAPANAPFYHRVDYTYTGAASGGEANALPTLDAFFGDQNIAVGGSTVLGAEYLLRSTPQTDFGNSGIGAYLFAGPFPYSVCTVGISRSAGLASVNVFPPRDGGDVPPADIADPTGWRVGFDINGATGRITFLWGKPGFPATFGSCYSEAGYVQEGSSVSMLCAFLDDGSIPEVTGQEISVQFVPNAADMRLTHAAGATDWDDVEI